MVGRSQLWVRACGTGDLLRTWPSLSEPQHVPVAQLCPAPSHRASARLWALAVDPTWCCFPTLQNSLGFLLLLCSAGRQLCYEAQVCAGSWQSFPALCSLVVCMPGVPCGDPLLLWLALIEHHSWHRTALTVTQRKNLFSEA